MRIPVLMLWAAAATSTVLSDLNDGRSPSERKAKRVSRRPRPVFFFFFFFFSRMVAGRNRDEAEMNLVSSRATMADGNVTRDGRYTMRDENRVEIGARLR